MKKTTLAIWFVMVFILYVAYERMHPAPAPLVALSGANDQVAGTSSAIAPSPSSPGSSSATAATTASVPASKSAAATPQRSTGQYRDGTYTGPSVNAYYGNVKVQAVISGGKLSNVIFLNYPQSHPASMYINSQAMPYLTQEALQMQSANVDIISGATFTSEAFAQSLASALAQAKNS
jgi:uncharacterized protein with FMN-binding domain